jgi:undecaprenyl-diphosphatase
VRRHRRRGRLRPPFVFSAVLPARFVVVDDNDAVVDVTEPALAALGARRCRLAFLRPLAEHRTMNPIEAVVLGLVQGATEYIPVSSTAHLLIVPWLFGWTSPSAAFDVLVQLGTLGAVVLYLRADVVAIVRSSVRGLLARQPLIDEHATMGWMIVAATIPAVVSGLLFEDAIDASMGDARAVFIQLIVNGGLLAGAEWLGQRQRARFGADGGQPLTWGRAVLVGFGQALAIIPAISRSGATIATALVLGLNRGQAARFSFLLSIPVMLGAGVLKGLKLLAQPELLAREGTGLAIAFVVAAVVGFAVIVWLQGFLRRHTLYGFAAWCVVMGIAGLAAGVVPVPAPGDVPAAPVGSP